MYKQKCDPETMMELFTWKVYGFQLLLALDIFNKGILVALQYLFHYHIRSSFFLASFNLWRWHIFTEVLQKQLWIG